jgi:predicted nucleic acid-binding protein
MASNFRDLLRRIKPGKRREQLRPRAATQVEFLGSSGDERRRLLYDTTVYVDILQDRFPRNGDSLLRAADAWHSTVTEAELAALCGLLDGAHPGTRVVLERVAAMIDLRPPHRTIAPDRETWQFAGVLAGTLARLQQYGGAERRRALNDALIFSSARKYGLTILTRNVRDFDLLQQLDPSTRVLFYSLQEPEPRTREASE